MFGAPAFLAPARVSYPDTSALQGSPRPGYVLVLAHKLGLEEMFLQAHSVCKKLGCAEMLEAVLLQYGRNLPTAWAYRTQIVEFLQVFSSLPLDILPFSEEACPQLRHIFQNFKNNKAPFQLYLHFATAWSRLYRMLQTQDLLFFLNITVTYPSLPFLQKLIDREDLPNLFQKIHYSQNLSDLLNLHAFLEGKGPLKPPHLLPEMRLEDAQEAFFHELKEEDPKIRQLLTLLPQNYPGLAPHIFRSMAAWQHLGFRSHLIDLLIDYPFDFQASQDEIHRDLSLLLNLLQMGSEGSLEIANDLSLIPRGDLRRDALMHEEAFLQPLLTMVIWAMDPEDLQERELLERFIKNPKDPWNQLLLYLSQDNPFCDISQHPQLPLLQELARQGRIYLALQLASASTLPVHPDLSDALSHDPLEHFSFLVQSHTKAYIKVSYRHFSSDLKTDPLNHECYVETASAIGLAKTLLEGASHLDKARLSLALQFLESSRLDNDSFRHMRFVVKALLFYPNLRDRLSYSFRNTKLSSLGQDLIRTLLQLPENLPITMYDIQVTLLSAILCRSRQVLQEADCFSIFHTIYLQSTPEGLAHLLADYREILFTGKFLIDTPKDASCELSNSIHQDDLFIHKTIAITHPLARAKDHALAQASAYNRTPFLAIDYLLLKEDSPLRQACKDLAAPSGQEDIRFDHCFRSILKAVHDLSQLRHLLFSGSSSGEKRWQLVWKDSQKPINDWESYLQLYQKALQLAGDLWRHVPLYDALANRLLPYLTPKTPESDLLSNALIRPDHPAASLWSDVAGGYGDSSLATYYFQHNLPHLEPCLASVEELAYNLFMHVHLTCSSIPHAEEKYPFSFPNHVCNLLPSHIATYMAPYSSPKEALKALLQDLKAAEQGILDLATQKLIIQHLAHLTKEFLQPPALEAFYEAMRRFPLLDHTTAQAFAKQLLINFALSQEDPFTSMKDFYNAVDITFLKCLPNAPLFLFADTNWAAKGHLNLFLAFGWSFSQKRLTVVQTTRNRKKISSFPMEFGSDFTLYPKIKNNNIIY